jgi:hypothetical protein
LCGKNVEFKKLQDKLPQLSEVIGFINTCSGASWADERIEKFHAELHGYEAKPPQGERASGDELSVFENLQVIRSLREAEFRFG